MLAQQEQQIWFDNLNRERLSQTRLIKTRRPHESEKYSVRIEFVRAIGMADPAHRHGYFIEPFLSQTTPEMAQFGHHNLDDTETDIRTSLIENQEFQAVSAAQFDAGFNIGMKIFSGRIDKILQS